MELSRRRSLQGYVKTTVATFTPRYLHLSVLVPFLLAFPVTYFVISYTYLAWWHKEVFLWDTVIHENGRLTLAGSLFYFDHFVACVPMITVFALCTAGGVALSGQIAPGANGSRARFSAVVLLSGAGLLVLGAFIASVYMVGWERTIDYALQRIERDGVTSKGGNWNQLQLSNIPIALGIIGLGSTFVMFKMGYNEKRDARLNAAGRICISVAAALMVGISACNFNGWEYFLNPRWMAHSIRELATHPVTGVPIALTSILLVERYISGLEIWVIKPRRLSLILIGIAIVIVAAQLLFLKNVDVLAIAQKPAFAADTLSIPYLLCSHVFEHFLDFVLIAILTGGIYAALRHE